MPIWLGEMCTLTRPSWNSIMCSTTTTKESGRRRPGGVEEDTNKRNKNDFVLWFTKSNLRTKL